MQCRIKCFSIVLGHFVNRTLFWLVLCIKMTNHIYPDSKVHGVNMGPIWGQQDPGGPHVGPMNFVMFAKYSYKRCSIACVGLCPAMFSFPFWIVVDSSGRLFHNLSTNHGVPQHVQTYARCQSGCGTHSVCCKYFGKVLMSMSLWVWPHKDTPHFVLMGKLWVVYWKYLNENCVCLYHYNDVIMGMIASQINSLTIVYSTIYSDTDQRKHQSSTSLAFVRGIHWRPVNSPHKWPVTWKMFPFDDVIMMYSCVI